MVKKNCVSLWASITNYIDWVAYKQQIYFSTVLKTERSKIQPPADLMSGEGLLPDSQTTVFCLCPHMTEGAGEFCGASFIKALLMLMRALSSWPNHLPKVLPCYFITTGIWFQHRNSQGNTNIQSVRGGYGHPLSLRFWVLTTTIITRSSSLSTNMALLT